MASQQSIFEPDDDIRTHNLGQHIPQTPSVLKMKESPIEDILRDMFCGVICVRKVEGTEIVDYFSDYDHYEPFIREKTYSMRSYYAGYKGKIREYVNYAFILLDQYSEPLEYYVVAKRIQTEIDKLAKYCPCMSCTSFNFNPLKYLRCRHCHGCLKLGSITANKDLIELAKLNKKSNKIHYTYWNWLELTALGVFGLITYINLLGGIGILTGMNGINGMNGGKK